MSLEDLGWSDERAVALAALRERDAAATPEATPLEVARVCVEYGAQWSLSAGGEPFWAELSGTLLRRARTEALARPAVGDWVAYRPDGSNRPLIHEVLPRDTCFTRQAAGKRVKVQVIAANVDTVFIVTSCNDDFNPRRLERYATAVMQSGARPVVLLNKADLVEDVDAFIGEVPELLADMAVLRVSATTGLGLEALAPYLCPGRTVAFVGSSGVGKSTLINALLGTTRQETGEIRETDDRGRHTTTHRELMLIPPESEGSAARGILIDTPGMRELALWGEDGGSLDEAFADIATLAQNCKFADCQHVDEPDCAVLAAVTAGGLSGPRLQSFRKLRDERDEHQERQREQTYRHAKRQGARLGRPRRKG